MVKQHCYNVEVSKNTAGNPIYKRVCFCGTTACRDYTNNKFFEVDNEEKNFYKIVHKTNTL